MKLYESTYLGRPPQDIWLPASDTGLVPFLFELINLATHHNSILLRIRSKLNNNFLIAGFLVILPVRILLSLFCFILHANENSSWNTVVQGAIEKSLKSVKWEETLFDWNLIKLGKHNSYCAVTNAKTVFVIRKLSIPPLSPTLYL